MPKIKTNYYGLNNIPKKYILLSMVVFLCIQYTQAQQSKKDSLRTEIINMRLHDNFTPKDTVYINKLLNLANTLRYYNNDSLLLTSQQSLNHSLEIGYKLGEVKSLNQIGNYYSAKGNRVKSVFYFEKAYKKALAINNLEYCIGLHNDIGIEYDHLGDYAMALREYLKGIDIAKEVGDKKSLSLLNENVGLLYGGQKNYAEALIYLKKAEKINDIIKDDISSAITKSNLASLYLESGNIEYSMYHINKSITVFEREKIMDWLAYAFRIKGEIYSKQKKYKWALFWYSQSQMLYDKNVEDKIEELWMLAGKAKAHLGMEKDNLSEVCAKKAFEISNELKNNEGIKESAEILYKINKSRNNYSNALRYHEIFQKLADTISQNASKKNLVMLKTTLDYNKQKEELINTNEKALAKQKNYIYATLSILFILSILTFLVTRSERVQKRLNKELYSKKVALEKNEHELIGINETKTKLFSIIGHDLRAPIGAFQGILNLYKTGEVNQKEFLSFVPKLRADINHIGFTLNNLLLWGQTQMNGSVTMPSIVCMENVVLENINLLSEIANAKSIKIVSKIPENAMVWSDIDQIDIVVRNLISNALKFTPENGMVTVGARENNYDWEFYVEDTGIGIDIETQKKIFAKNSNITTYGTNNEKGTGLGLMLCKEMIDNNKGNIWLKSIPEKGTCFYFTVPKTNKKYEKAS